MKNFHNFFFCVCVGREEASKNLLPTGGEILNPLLLGIGNEGRILDAFILF